MPTLGLSPPIVLMEPTTGIEPVNLFLTKEALYRLSYVGVIFAFGGSALRSRRFQNKGGAGDESRTRDIQLGRLKLYQLSYSRPGYPCQVLEPAFTPIFATRDHAG